MGKSDFVRLKEIIPDLVVELRYATNGNFTGKQIYAFHEAWLRYGTALKLAKVQQSLKAQGYGLKIWDAFRPVSAQFVLWSVCPDARYVADPIHGFSDHSRGNTVDVTLIDSTGTELNMPTEFDSFSTKADRDYSDVEDQNAVANAQLLEQEMQKAGFIPYFHEWWHFSDSDSYEPETEFTPAE